MYCQFGTMNHILIKKIASTSLTSLTNLQVYKPMNLSDNTFYTPIQSALQGTQQRFDEYQRACFVARPPEFFSLELCGEAGELANLEKKLWKGKDIPFDAVADEAADVLIALMNYANARGVNLGDAVVQKLRRIEGKRQALAERGEAY
jgi:NTP pyrophosphatase (non-canonical NTP hydrolase)